MSEGELHGGTPLRLQEDAVYVIVTKFSQRGQSLVTMGQPHFFTGGIPPPHTFNLQMSKFN